VSGERLPLPLPQRAHSLRPPTPRLRYELRIEQLSEQLDALLHDRRLSELDAGRRSVEAAQARTAVEAEAAAAVAAARAGQAAAEMHLSALRTSLDISKSSFVDLRISPALAAEIRAQPAVDRTLRNDVLLRVHDAVQPLATRAEGLQRELDAAQERVADADGAKARAVRAVASTAAASEERAVSAEERVAALTASLARATASLTAERERAEGMTFKVTSADAVEAARVAAVDALGREREAHEQAQAEAESGRAGRLAVEARASALAQRLEVLIVEKGILASAVERAEGTAREAEREAAGLRAGEERTGSLEERFQAELGRTRAEREAALVEVRTAMATVNERALKEAREREARAAEEAREWRAQAEGGRAASGREINELRTALTASTSLTSTLRASLEASVREVGVLRAGLEESRSGWEGEKRETAMLREGLGEARAEVARLAVAGAKEGAAAEVRIAALTASLHGYGELEDGLDGAVLAAGRATAGGDSTGAAVASLGALGASSRRTAQAVDLARQLALAVAEASAAHARADSLAAALDEAKAASARLRVQLDAVHGPAEYFLTALREREEEVVRARAEAERGRSDVATLRARLAETAAGREAAVVEAERTRDRLVLVEGSLASLRAAIGGLRGGAGGVPPLLLAEAAKGVSSTPPGTGGRTSARLDVTGEPHAFPVSGSARPGTVARTGGPGEPQVLDTTTHAAASPRATLRFAPPSAPSSPAQGGQPPRVVRRTDPASGHSTESPAAGGSLSISHGSWNRPRGGGPDGGAAGAVGESIPGGEGEDAPETVVRVRALMWSGESNKRAPAPAWYLKRPVALSQ
jgi:hypothetical protein